MMKSEVGLIPYMFALLLSLMCVWGIHPYLVRLALRKRIVDNPNARKLNRVPVPVLGGVGIFVGFVVAFYSVATIMDIPLPSTYIVVFLLMLGVGLVDDLCDLKPRSKFAMQVLAVLLLYFVCDLRIDNLYGIFGLYELPSEVSLPLTLVACVGLINSINLIDGIDGLSSGYSIVALGLFAIWAIVQDNSVNLLMACALIGALIPFFVYNVFGRKNKMFMGDAGSYLLGIIFCVIVLNIMDSSSNDIRIESTSIPFVLAVLSHPIMDTLRVMVMRICKGYSPFKADKTHLHHALIGKGLKHLTTTLIIIGLDLLVVFAWLGCYKCGLSATSQFIVVIMVAVVCIILPYPLLVKK